MSFHEVYELNALWAVAHVRILYLESLNRFHLHSFLRVCAYSCREPSVLASRVTQKHQSHWNMRNSQKCMWVISASYISNWNRPIIFPAYCTKLLFWYKQHIYSMSQIGAQLVKRFTENMHGHFLPQHPLLFSLFLQGLGSNRKFRIRRLILWFRYYETVVALC